MIYNVYDLDVQAYCLYPKFTIIITINYNEEQGIDGDDAI